jgi:L-alanine-DL-glutamate epimerase-like enolase superfamily enzyme
MAKARRRSSRRSRLYAPHLPRDPFDLESTERALKNTLADNPSARAALSTALHDLVGKRLGVPLYRLWGLDPAATPISTFTIGLDTADKMRAKVLEAEPYPVLKVKLGTNRDDEILRTIRGATDKELRVDANCGWTRKQANPYAADARGVRRDGAGAAASRARS